jgi:integrase
MQTRNLTAKAIDKIQPDPSRRVEVPDGIVSGLYLVVTPTGSKSWALRYRFRTRPRKMTFGKYPTISLMEARQRARAALEEVQAGKDPARDKQARRAPLSAPDTVSETVVRYIEDHAKRKTRRWQETERLFRLYVLPRCGDLPLKDFNKWEIRPLIAGIVDDGKPVQANRVLAAIKTMLNWCVSEDLIDSNPAMAVQKPTRERIRERKLGNEELKAVIMACEELDYPGGSLIKMLVLTGQRRDEVRLLRWREIDLEHAIWTLPGERAKNGQSHLVPLSGLVLTLLDSLPRFPGEFVFSASAGRSPYSNLVKPKRAIDKMTGVTDWTLHDLRRTAATGMGQLGIAGETIARVLNHSERAIAGVTARYNQHEYTAAKRHALEAWARHVEGLIEPQRENVVPLQKQKDAATL